MKKLFNILVFSMLSIAFLSACNSPNTSSNPITKERKDMEKIEFIPKEFHDVELTLYSGKEYPCTPGYPEVLFEPNIVLVNTPQKIIYRSYNKDTTPIIPLCALFAISEKRALKYDHLSTKVIHIKKVGQYIIYSGEVVDPILRYEDPALPPNYYEEQEKIQQRIKEAQKYSDEELNDGLVGGSALSINILEYVDMPLSEGKYEIWISALGLDSNHTIVEIIMDGDVKVLNSQFEGTGTPANTPTVEEEDIPEI